jgi:predicted dehydrogenase
MTKSVSDGHGRIGVGVIGLGHWGPNYLRVLKMIPAVRLVSAAEPDPARWKSLGPAYPELAFHEDADAVLADPEVRAVVIATPSSTHYRMTKRALLAGKDVLCEKPLALTGAECRDLVRTAGSRRRVLMVGHIFLYNSGVLKIKEYLDAKRLGRVYYLTAVRTNLGPVREDVNVVYDLAAHDVSIFNYILGARPRRVEATGGSFFKAGREDFCFISLHYPRGVVGHIHVSWLTPIKQRQLLVVGSHRMITWNDQDSLEPLKVYDSGPMEEPFYADYGSFQRMLRVADIHLPQISPAEPLLAQTTDFINCVRRRTRPLADGNNGLATVLTLEQIQQALGRAR